MKTKGTILSPHIDLCDSSNHTENPEVINAICYVSFIYRERECAMHLFDICREWGNLHWTILNISI